MRALRLLVLFLATPAIAAPSHITSNGPTPSADCGSVIGTDSSGKITITVTTNPPFCTLTFAQTWAHGAPDCVAGGPENMSQVTIATQSQAEFHNGDGRLYGNLLHGDVITYICLGH